MPVTNYSYVSPGVTVTAQGAQTQQVGGPPRRILVMAGTASKGPDFPCLMTPAQAISVFGAPTLAANLGHTLPLALAYVSGQRPTSAPQSAFLVLAGRVGVTRATIPVLDQTGSPLTCFNIAGIGAYAGSAGNHLSIVFNVTATVLTSIQIFDTTSGSVLKQSFSSAQYDLTSAAKVFSVINGANPLTNPNSIVHCDTLNTAALVPMQQTVVPTGGLDGLGTAAGDASIATFLSNSLYSTADYVWLGFDAAAVQTTVSAHLAAAAAGNDFRKAILGPKQGVTNALMLTNYGSVYTSNRVAIIAHPGLSATNPVTGQSTIIDAFYAAAAYAGLKCSCAPQYSGTTWSLAGFTGIALTSDVATPLTSTQMDALAATGLLVLARGPNGGIVIRDAITTAPQYVNNLLNPFYQLSVQDIDDAVTNAAIAAVLPFKGQPAAPLPVQVNQLTAAVANGLAGLNDTINGVNSLVVSVDPLTGVPQVNLSYITRFPQNQIEIVTNFTYL